MKKKKKKNEETDRAQKAKKRALVKIQLNIEKIHKNEKVQRNIRQLRKDIHINNGRVKLYEKHKKEIEKIRSIHKLIKFLMRKWIKQISKKRKVKETVTTYLARYNIMLEYKGESLSSENVKAWSTFKNKKYLRHVIENFIEGKNWTYEVIRINSRIWKSVISAMLFDIPEETIIRLRESILEDYLPKINEDLTIQINELTAMGDFEIIEQKIKRAKRRYARTYKYLNSKRTETLVKVSL